MANEIILFVNSAKVDCTGVGPMKCLEIQESEKVVPGKWQLFYNSIDGFNYQPGYIYKLLVKKEKLDPAKVPADGSTLRYTLVKVIEKTKSEEFLLDDIWSVKSINGKMIDIPKTKDEAENLDLILTIDLLEMKILGYDGCNNFYGTIETSAESLITLKLIGATEMACSNMELPTAYTLALERTNSYKLSEEALYFYDTNGTEVLKFEKAE